MSSSEVVEEPEAGKPRSVLRYWWVMVLAVVLCAGVLVGASFILPTTYTSSAKVLYRTDNGSALLGTSASSEDVDMVMATQAQVVLSDAVMQPAAEELGLTPQQLEKRTSADHVPNSNVLTISVDGDTPEQAVKRTSTVTDVYIGQLREAAQKSLRDQSRALRPSIAALKARLGALKEEAPTRAGTEATLTSLIQRQAQLDSAAAAEKGPVEMLATPQQPSSPSSLTAVNAAVLGVVAGLVLGAGLLLLTVGTRSRHK